MADTRATRCMSFLAGAQIEVEVPPEGASVSLVLEQPPEQNAQLGGLMVVRPQEGAPTPLTDWSQFDVVHETQYLDFAAGRVGVERLALQGPARYVVLPVRLFNATVESRYTLTISEDNHRELTIRKPASIVPWFSSDAFAGTTPVVVRGEWPPSLAPASARWSTNAQVLLTLEPGAAAMRAFITLKWSSAQAGAQAGFELFRLKEGFPLTTHPLQKHEDVFLLVTESAVGAPGAQSPVTSRRCVLEPGSQYCLVPNLSPAQVGGSFEVAIWCDDPKRLHAKLRPASR